MTGADRRGRRIDADGAGRAAVMPASAEAGPTDLPSEGTSGHPPDFAVATRRFLQDQITLADSKAAVVSTVSIAVLAYLLRAGAGADWHRALEAWGWDSALGLGAVLALGAGIVSALAAVIPRTSGRPEGYVFWRAILAHETPADYARAILELDGRELEAALLEDCHRLSGICSRKFAVVRRAMWSASLGLLLALLWLALFAGSPPPLA